MAIKQGLGQFAVQPADWGQSAMQLGGLLNQVAQQQQQQRNLEGAIDREIKGAADAKLAAQQQAQAQQQAIDDLYSAYESGDRMGLVRGLQSNPQLAQSLIDDLKFKSDQTKEGLLETQRSIVMGANPIAALESHAQSVIDQGGTPSHTLAELERVRKMTPEQIEMYRGEVETDLAALSPESYEDFIERRDKVGAGVKPTANIQDFEYYKQLKLTDPVAADQFAIQTGILRDEPELKQTTAMQNFDRWAEMPDGPEKEAFGKVIGITPKESIKDITNKAEKQAEAEIAVASLDDTILNAEALLTQDGFSDYFGFSSMIPAIPGSSKADFAVAIESFLDNLTIENLEKIAGPLTDNDMAVVKSASSGIKPSMSEEAARKKLMNVINLLKSKRNRESKKLSPMNTQTPAPESAAGAPSIGTVDSGYRFLGGDPSSPSSWEKM